MSSVWKHLTSNRRLPHDEDREAIRPEEAHSDSNAFFSQPSAASKNNPIIPPPLAWTRGPEQSGADSSREGSISENFSSRLDSTSSFINGELQRLDGDYWRDMKCEVMVNYLHAQQEEKLWTSGAPGEGVVLKKTKGQYACCPGWLEGYPIYKAIATLNVRVAMTISTRVITLVLERNRTPYVEIMRGLRLQVVPNVQALVSCQKHQFAAFIADQRMLVVWEDEPKRLLERGEYIQSCLLAMIWGSESKFFDEKNVFTEVPKMGDGEDKNGQKENLWVEKPRRIMLIQPVMTAATLILVLAAIGSGWRQVAIEISVDGNLIRLAFAACILPQMWLALFFFQALIGNITQLIGPIGQMKENTKFYSGIPPRRLKRDDISGLPHVTIQMPVYKEGLRTVIEPTVQSLKAAISTYELQGGTANIFVNDDGMQLLSEEAARERQDFYDEHNIGWVARPKHNPKPVEGETVFHRRGKFKKASNMNYALHLSVQVEEKLSKIERGEDWAEKEESEAYRRILAEVVEESNGAAWADGNIRIGDYILLVDSDTRVPTDCLLEAVSEMEHSPQVAILQFSSGVMNVTDSFFERGITFFTNLVYTQIQYAVANGDVAPFVGHNAILRWSALQDIAYDCHADKREKYWSENTVSEDFDMALRLQTTGYLIRLCAYKGSDFKEGVSLTVYDELARWEKYAYGCNELIFHPLRSWPTRGPFTPIFRKFILSRMPLPSKLTILAYIGTYYALGSAWLLTLANYFLVGWFNGFLDHYYIDSFKVYFSIIVVFTALGNIALAVLRYRSASQPLFSALWQNFKWIPLLVIFLGGISLHVSQALLCHFFSINMTWGATAKEVEHVSFFEEIPRVVRRFKFTFLWCFAVGAMMVVMARWAPVGWEIVFLTPVWPLAAVVVSHFLLPVVLNPNLMLFTW